MVNLVGHGYDNKIWYLMRESPDSVALMSVIIDMFPWYIFFYQQFLELSSFHLTFTLLLIILDCNEGTPRAQDTLHNQALFARWKVVRFVLLGLSSYLDMQICYSVCALITFCNSYEDWGVDELIVEDSWKRQVGGD